MTRPRLLPLAIIACALAAPLYAGSVMAQREGGTSPAPAQPPVATSQLPQPSNSKVLEPGFTDLLAAKPAGMAPAPSCEPALAEMLAAERKALEAEKLELATRRQLLEAVEQRAQAQLARLEAARGEVAALLDKRTALANADLVRLVAIYEAMKPKDAARLLNETEPAILVDLLDRMQERRSAPILAEMDADKVNGLTRTLALRRVLPADRPPEQSAERR